MTHDIKNNSFKKVWAAKYFQNKRSKVTVVWKYFTVLITFFLKERDEFKIQININEYTRF